MKKILTLVCCTILLAATSCKKETIVGPGAVTVFTNANTWVASTSGSFLGYTADVSVPDIDNYYDKHGAVLVYIDYGTGEYELLPNVNGGNSLWYTFAPGHVYINSQNADGTKPTQDPGNLKLKIVLIP